ncbi:MAG: cysteine hydrolase [Phycisphaerales bacterium]|nr:cysteine hydrolase [Hyphomonadaceae bacterium]
MTQAFEAETYDAERTALLFVDPYNDFLSEGGKLWPLVADVAASVKLHDNLRAILVTARDAGVAVFVVPHHRAEPDDFAGWDHPTPYQRAGSQMQAFAKGSWGGEFHDEFAPQPGDTIVKEHWTASGFANTDLDFLLKQKGISHVILIGLIANTCIEGTARNAVDLGYHVTLVRDATAAFSHEAMHAPHDINAPNFAHAVLTTAKLVTHFRKEKAQ